MSSVNKRKLAVSEEQKSSDASFFDTTLLDKYTLGEEPGAPVGGSYFHVMPKTVKVDESAARRLFVITEDVDVIAAAKERFGVTNDIRECGYVLPSGEMLDFSGRNYGSTEYGRRRLDHRDIGDLNYLEDLNTRSGLDVDMEKFIRLGAIRIHCSRDWSMINLYNKPTNKQRAVLSFLIRYSNGCVDVEIGDGNESYCYGAYDKVSPRRVLADIDRYFDDGIKFKGNVTESKNGKKYDEYPFNEGRMRRYLNVLAGAMLSEEVVADGSADHNPYAKKWKQERDALKNFIVHNGALMTSKENGKQYYVYVDYYISNMIGYNYCLCLQWDPYKREVGSTPYFRALDKFTSQMFRPEFDTRGFDNVAGTYDDVRTG